MVNIVRAKKYLGQNFLHDHEVLSDITKAGELTKTDTVVEIGPGLGFLTEELLKKTGRVIAVELDKDLLPGLKTRFFNNKHFTLIHEDALKFAPPAGPYKLIANIPYYITSPILNHFLLEQFICGNPPQLMVLMIQKEVAEKILAKKGKHSVLSLQIHVFGEPELVRNVSKTAFRPIPKVDSALVKIRVHKKPKIEGDLKRLFHLFHAGFSQKRKKLSNSLGAFFRLAPHEFKVTLEKLGLSADLRAEDLKMEEWKRLFNELESRLHSS